MSVVFDNFASSKLHYQCHVTCILLFQLLQLSKIV